jgi:uncharacterized sulfatase
MTARPNVVWVTLDSVRQDRTSVGGHRRDTTPELRRIANQPTGEAFDQCIATDKWSLSSAASIHTGTYPEYHGTGYRTDVLPETVDTVAERFGAAGYRTVGLSVNHFFSESTGLDRGFDAFRMIDPLNFVRVAGPGITARFVANLRRHSGGFSLDKRKHRPDYVLNELMKRRISGLAAEAEPFFLTAHYHGAHHPYYPPRPARERFADELPVSSRRAANLAFEHTTDLHAEIARADSWDDLDWRAIRTMYDALVAYCDGLVGELFDHLQSLDIGPTVFVVTADHGDLLGEYGLLGHELVLHDALIRVPLVVHGLDAAVGRDDELVQHPDVMRTLLELADAPTDGLQGIDLREASRSHAISQREAGGRDAVEAIREHDPNFDGSRFHLAKLTAVRTDSFKYQRSADGSELFALPDETKDVAADHPEVAAELDAYLIDWLASAGSDIGGGAEADFDEGVRERLGELGYLIK